MEELAWYLFALYYCGIHATTHLSNCIQNKKYIAPLFCFLAYFIQFPNIETIDVGPTIQLLIAAHVACQSCED